MNEQLVKEFQNKIVNANQSDLLVINYEMLMAELDAATERFEEEDRQGFTNSMRLATRLLRELSDNLDFRFSIAKELMSLYIFVNKTFLEAAQKHTVQPLKAAKDVLNMLLLGWKEVSKKEVGAAPLYKNSQQVYAGLTYGKGELNETVYSNGIRGFEA